MVFKKILIGNIVLFLLFALPAHKLCFSQTEINDILEEDLKEESDYPPADPDSAITPHKFGVNESPVVDEGYFPGVTNEELELSEEQVEELKEIKAKARSEKTVLFKELEIPEGELNELLGHKNPSIRKVDTKISKMGKIQSEIHKIDIHELIESRKVLTIKQWKKVKKAEQDQIEE